MANLQNFKTRSQTGFLTGLGQKAKNLVEFGAGLKSMYDTGKTIYSAVQMAAPYLEAALPLLGVL